MDRLNQLKQYMDFYKSNGMAPKNNGDAFSNPYGGIGSGFNATSLNPNTFAANWANSQLGADSQESQQMPDFYGDQGGYQPAQYTAPNYNTPTQSNSTNYLRKLLEGRGTMQRNATQGVRG